MAQELTFFEQAGNQLPAHLQGVNLGVTNALMQGLFTGGNRIGVKGSRFRIVVNGNEEQVIEENYLDVIIVAAAPAVSRRYYQGAYSATTDNGPPVCYSSDGVVPNEDVKQKQSDKCASCPQNIKGSKMVDGVAMKACAYFRRLVCVLNNDTDYTVFQFDANAQTLFGDNGATAKGLNDYIKMLASRGVDAGQIITRMSFDTNASVPKVLFKPIGFVSVEQLNAVKELVTSDEVKMAATVSMATLDLSKETSDHSNEGQDEAASTQQEAPAPQQAQKPVQQAQRPAQTRPATTAAPAKPAQQRPVQAQPVVEDIPDSAPAPQEVTSNTELEDILGSLDI